MTPVEIRTIGALVLFAPGVILLVCATQADTCAGAVALAIIGLIHAAIGLQMIRNG